MRLATPSALEIAHLRLLEVLLRTGSTVRAARELGLSQSAVSHALARLRELLDDPLFVRVGRKLAPTDRALALRAPLEEALAAVARVLESAEAVVPATLQATFRVFAADYSELAVLPRLLAVLAVEAPEVDLVTIAVEDVLEDRLQRGEADLALGGFFEERGGLLLRPLFRDPFVVVMAATAAPQQMSLERYLAARHVRIAPRGAPGGLVDTRLAALGHTRRVVLRTPCFQTALAIAARTDLWATLPRSLALAVGRHEPIGVFAPPFELQDVRFAMLFPASRREDLAHRWLRERIASLFA